MRPISIGLSLLLLRLVWLEPIACVEYGNETVFVPDASDAALGKEAPRVGVYYINLDRSPERRAYMEKMLRRTIRPRGDFARVRAVDRTQATHMLRLLGADGEKSIRKFVKQLCPKGNVAHVLCVDT
eukprot:Selendium_serpulae@DN5744_c4_g1_i8.p1